MNTDRCISTADGGIEVDGPRGTPAHDRRRAGATGARCLLVLAVAGCGSPTEPANSPETMGAPTRRDTTIVHESCDLESGSAVRGDANGDGHPDVITVSDSGQRTCQWLDLNFDRVADVWVYFGADGAVRRRETDFDRDGRIDELTTLAQNAIVTRQRATTLAGRLDTWQYFEGGVLTRGERDANGDGVIDQWWEYPKAGRPSECAVVHSDTNGDGRPDPGATVDLCANEDAAAGDSLAANSDAPAFDAPLTETTADVPNAAPPSDEGTAPRAAETPAPQGPAAEQKEKQP